MIRFIAKVLFPFDLREIASNNVAGTFRHVLSKKLQRRPSGMAKTSQTPIKQGKRTRPTAPTNPTTGGFAISDELWTVLEPLLPPSVNTHRFGGGRPRTPDRKCANGLFYVWRTGCQWKALDTTGICSGSTAHLRFQEWVEAGVFLDLWRVGLERYDELNGLDWSWLSMDGAMTKAPLGGEKNRQKPCRPWQGRRQTQSADRSHWHSHRPGR
jgi:transposase